MLSVYNIFLVLKTGRDFHFRDVELICYHLKKQWKEVKPLNIYCLYDKVHQIVKLKDCTLLPMNNNTWPGWWCKMNLFSPELEKYRPFLFLDLDTAIVGDIIDLFPIDKYSSRFICLADLWAPNRLASGVMWLPNNKKIKNIWKVWSATDKSIMQTNLGDGDFLQKITNADLYWQGITDKISSFKPILGGTFRYLYIIPKEKTVICFHGKPRIWDAEVVWVKEYITKYIE